MLPAINFIMVKVSIGPEDVTNSVYMSNNISPKNMRHGYVTGMD